MSLRTTERILDGAMEAVARHGVAKLEMSDVSVSAGLSRATVYRYFPNRDVLISELTRREALRFKEEMLAAIANAPAGPERILIALEHATRRVAEHPALRRLPETDPAPVLRGLRARFPAIKGELGQLLAPLLDQTYLVRRGVVTSEQLVDWMLRLMISAFLLPEATADEMARGLTAVYRMLTAPPVADASPRVGAARRDRPARRRPRHSQQGKRRRKS
jgi:AcrR family transcriptional regulator